MLTAKVLRLSMQDAFKPCHVVSVRLIHRSSQATNANARIPVSMSCATSDFLYQINKVMENKNPIGPEFF
jgi:hypothetical protein